jgi:GNAT superfamily N-acetyltransferase
MIFREANVKDIPAMRRVRNAVKENRLSDPARITDEHYRPYLARRGKGWVCERKHQLLGFAIADLQERNIWALFVHPDEEGKKIGQQLHALMLDWYFSKTKETVWLSTEPAGRAEKFYLKQGRRPTGQTATGETRFEMHYKYWLNRKTY